MTNEERAKFYTGYRVVKYSMQLEMKGERKLTAEAFFEARSLLGIEGYMTEEEALKVLEDRPCKKN